MIAIISDIHGNHAALTAVLEAVDAQGVESIVCLGDVAGYYSQINECCDTLRARDVLCLMGNHDAYLVSGTGCPRSDSATRCLAYQESVITPENRAWLARLPDRASHYGVEMVHGGWRDPLEEYLRPSQAYFDAIPGKNFASGHTHVPIVWRGEQKTYCNPGAVGQPRDGDPRAAYALWDGEAFSLHRTEYDISLTQAQMAAQGFSPYFYENLSIGSRIGGKIDKYD